MAPADPGRDTSMNLNIGYLKVDTTPGHIKKPGSRGGHIIGYRKGEPIYGKHIQQKIKPHVKPHVGNTHSGYLSDPTFGEHRSISFWKNPTINQVRNASTSARGFITPDGSFYLLQSKEHNVHRDLLAAMHSSGLVGKDEYANIQRFKNVPTWKPKNGISLVRVGGTDAFALGHSHLVEDMTNKQQKWMKELLTTAKKQSPGVSLLFRSIHDLKEDRQWAKGVKGALVKFHGTE